MRNVRVQTVKVKNIIMQVMPLLTLVIQPIAAMAAEPDPQRLNNSPTVIIPSGEFIMGSDEVETVNRGGEFGNKKPWYMDEHPKHTVLLSAYAIDEHEVTNGEYLPFVDAGKAAPPTHWLQNGFILSTRRAELAQIDVEKLRQLAVKTFKLDMDTRTMSKEQILKAIDERLAYEAKLPVIYINWNEANAYCQWRGKRLPTEAEWEKAARGNNGRQFPWGDEWRPGLSNTGEEAWDDGVAPVESYPSDKSEFGVYDLAGNVSEWVMDWYKPYPGSDYRSDDFGEKFKVVRGAGWGGEGHYALKLFQRGAYRFNLPPSGTFEDVGFRCAADVPKNQALSNTEKKVGGSQ